MRPVKFKIDVTDFWAPRISATLQAVLNVGNRNLLDLLRGLALALEPR